MRELDIREILAANVEKLRSLFGLSQTKVAAKAGVQQQTVSNICAADAASGHSARIDTIDLIARKAFKVPAWTLLVPEIPETIEELRQLERLLSAYLKTTPEGRQYLVSAVAFVAKVPRAISNIHSSQAVHEGPIEPADGER